MVRKIIKSALRLLFFHAAAKLLISTKWFAIFSENVFPQSKSIIWLIWSHFRGWRMCVMVRGIWSCPRAEAAKISCFLWDWTRYGVSPLCSRALMEQFPQSNEIHSRCLSPLKESSHCRHLHFCAIEQIKDDFYEFLRFFCPINKWVEIQRIQFLFFEDFFFF